MKRNLVLSILGLGVCCSGLGQPAQSYQNDGLFRAPPAIPPNINAINFINNGQFVINFTNGLIPFLPPAAGLPPYEMQNTKNYTNLFGKFMSCNSGFRMENYNSQTSLRQPAANFYNAGTINCGTVDTTNYFVTALAFFGPTGVLVGSIAGSTMQVNATNVANPGTINMGFESLLSIQGGSVDFNRATVSSELSGFSLGTGPNIGFFFNQELFDGNWNIGDVFNQPIVFYPFGINPNSFFGIQPPTTPLHPVTDRNFNTFVTELVLSNAVSYVSDVTDFSGSNRVVKVAFIQNTNADVQANVYFFPDITVEFTNTLGGTIGGGTNSLFGGTSNNLYIVDEFYLLTNFSLVPNGFAGNNVTFQPFDYFVFENPPLFLGPPAAAGPVPPGTFNNNATTNQWQAYQALLLPVSVPLTDSIGQDPTNLPGRVEITADKFLNLSQARIGALNYLSLQATNHFGGSGRAQIQAPLMDINLRSTNGVMNVTNLLIPQVNRPEGHIELYSARWTNVVIGDPTVTNAYHVLFCDAHFSPTSPARVQNLTLRSANGPGTDTLYLSDIVHVTKTMLLDANRITITTNAPGSPTPSGGIVIEDPGIVWPSSTPRLQYFTNNGFLQALNTIFFGGSRTSPYYTSNFDEPYLSFVNTGSITNFGSLIWATNFQNSGTIYATSGDIQLQLARGALMTNGMFLAPGGQIWVATGDLIVSNHLMQAGSSLTLYVTNLLDDGSLATGSADLVTNQNVWNVNHGINLFCSNPSNASLLATTVTNTDASYTEVFNTWSGRDLGCSPAGFSNNAALGRMVLLGQDPDSQFTFLPATSSNALYVDMLEMNGPFFTNANGSLKFSGVQVNPGMKIYYSQALCNGVGIAEKLNGQSGGAFCWVSNYNFGPFSSTTNFGCYCAACAGVPCSPQTLADGTVVRLNTALVSSCDLYSDPQSPTTVNGCNHTPLGSTPYGIRGPIDLNLTVSYTNGPPHGAVVSFNTGANATNSVYYKASTAGTNWLMLTNFLSGPVGGRVSVMDGIGQGARLYRVRVDVPK